MPARTLFKVYSTFFLLFLFQLNIAIGQETPRLKTIFEYLTPEEGSKFTLETDLTTLLENRRSTEYTPAVLTLENGKSFQVRVVPKGKYRRKVAEIPPLKIKFPKKALAAEGLDTLNEVKLVLPCYESEAGDELIVKEYLIYKMFEHLTSACVRARLVRVTLRDNHVEKFSRKMYALLVEDNEETAARLNGYEIEQFGMPVDSMVTQQVAMVALFEYMIGNTDWDIPMIRNLRLIRSKMSSRVLVIPYDFDFSGLVAAPYASPSSESGLHTVRDRFLMANGIPQEALRRAVQILKSAQKDLYAICRSKYLSRPATDDMIYYLDTFFLMIDKNNDVPGRMNVPVSD
ncbi:MAG: hypothetical protein IPM81_04625 [Saprospirales bacterium]|nr:hypothetical protein [Saprospirales bacterium]